MGLMLKIPSYFFVFYAINNVLAATGGMDAMFASPIIGTSPEQLPFMTSTAVHLYCLALAPYNGVLAVLFYPYSSLPKEVIKMQQTVITPFLLLSAVPMLFMLNAGMMGVGGVGQFVGMQVVVAVIALLNANGLGTTAGKSK